MELQDQIGRWLTLPQKPLRIVSLVPSQTELLCDLGLEPFIVGVTKFCIHPKHLRKQVKVVGGTKTLKIERIKALQPDIILCNKEENTKEILALCETVCPVHVSDIFTLEDALELMQQYGIMFQVEAEANRLIESIRSELTLTQGCFKDKTRVKVAYCIWKDPWMVAANNTFIDHLLEVNRMENVFKHLERYPMVSVKAMKEAAPDYVLLSSEPYPFKDAHLEALKLEMPSSTQILLVDGEMFSWYGSRLEKAFPYFRNLHHRF